LFCNPAGRPPASSRQIPRVLLAVAVIFMACVLGMAASSNAPPWMHALVNASLPAHDEKTEAVTLYSETNVNILPDHKTRTVVRRAYKILRPTGRDYGMVVVTFNPQRKITSLRGWCIPAQGRDYEVKDKDATEVSLPKIEGSELISDVKAKLLRIPAPDPGNIVGYEYEAHEQPLVLQDEWDFQGMTPVRESHYSLQIPSGWEYKTSWINYPEMKSTQAGSNQGEWAVSDVKAIREEEDMPPLEGIAGRMIVTFFPPGGSAADAFASWRDMGNWYQNLTSGRRDASAEIKGKVSALTAPAGTPLQKMRALAQFVQQDVRYVAVELGIGGWQPHPAHEVFIHRYGDCKDKATLMSSMLHEIGVDSYYVVINTQRGSATPDMPPHVGAFNHAIIAIKLPQGMTDPALAAAMQHPKLGKLLFFDPTSELIPFGQIGGYLQANYGLLVTPEGGELVELPRQPATTNGIQRTAKLALDGMGNLKGDVEELRVGDRAWGQRLELTQVTKDSDRIKPFEGLLADSLATFRITKASLVNLHETGQPLGFNYSFVAENYAKSAGSLLLVRPRVIGRKSSALLETKEPRKYPVEFPGPALDTDVFDITLPVGYEVEDLPPPVDADYSFASYHSKTEVHGNAIRYTRTLEVKELSVPVSRVEELKRFYRIIAGDERNTAVLRPATR